MDTIQPIGSTEILVARGKYNYRLAERNSGLKENWTVHRTPDNLLHHRTEVTGSVGAITLHQVAHLTRTEANTPLRLVMFQRLSEREAETEIFFGPDGLRQHITAEGRTAEQEIELPERYVLFYPPVSSQGYFINQYDLEQGGRQTIPLISLRMHPQDALPLSIEVRPIDYEYIKDEEVESPAGQFACRLFIRHEDEMQQKLWVDYQGMVIQWAVPYSLIMNWEYLLIQYQRTGA